MSESTSVASNRFLYGVGVGIGATMLYTGLSYWYKKYMKEDVMPLKWRRVGTLAGLHLFPVKSCAPLELSPETLIECDILGCRLEGIRDRGFMILDKDDEMITARKYPKMVLIHIKITGPKKLLLTYDTMEPLELDIETIVSENPLQDIHTKIWGVKVDAMLCGAKFDKWFSQVILGKDDGLRLVYFPYPEPVRGLNPSLPKEPYFTKQDTGAFNDTTSYMLMNLASTDDLNSRLENKVDPLRFRGNFYLKMDDSEPYAEDHWGWVKIGDQAIFRNVAPCARCIFPNINNKTGERDPKCNPLKELKKYRKCEKYGPSPLLGIQMGIRQAGSVKLNDAVYVEEKSIE